MRKRITLMTAIIALFALGLTACTGMIVGNGDVIEESRAVGDFDRINVSGVGIVNVTISDETSLTIRAESNIMEVLTSEVEGSTLRLGQRPRTSINPSRDIVYDITVPELEGVEVSGAARFNLPEIDSDAFTVEISGAGEVTIERLSAGRVTMETSGAGEMTVGSLTADSLDIEISGAGDVTINDGSVRELDVSSSGAGSVNAADVQVTSAVIELSGAGQATVRVRDEITGSLSGVGSLRYYGNPTIDFDTSGIGNVQQLGE